MRSDNNQLDILDDDPARKADANRRAAESARQAMQFPPSIRAERVQFYEAEAARFERLSAMCRGVNNG